MDAGDYRKADMSATLLDYRSATHDDYRRCYGSKLDDFCKVANELDPSGKMRNDWAEEKLFATAEAGRDWWLEDFVEAAAVAEDA